MRAFSRCAAAFGLALALAPSHASAEPWPQRTVRFIVPLPAGTATDIAARMFAQRLGERWGQTVIVENRPGADGIPAATAFVNARDKHTLMLSFAGLITINPYVHDSLPYDSARDLVPIASMVDNFFGIAVANSLKVASPDEFVRLARAQPGKLNWAATPGLPVFIFEAFQKQAAVKLTQISYREFAPAMRDLDEGRIDVAVTGLSTLMPHVRAGGSARLLMVTNRERSSLLPDVPTARDAGYPDLTFDGVVGLYGWRDMPDDLRDRIAADVRAVGADPAIGARFATFGTVVRLGTPAEFAAAIEEQRAKIAAIARSLKPTQ